MKNFCLVFFLLLWFLPHHLNHRFWRGIVSRLSHDVICRAAATFLCRVTTGFSKNHVTTIYVYIYIYNVDS